MSFRDAFFGLVDGHHVDDDEEETYVRDGRRFRAEFTRSRVLESSRVSRAFFEDVDRSERRRERS